MSDMRSASPLEVTGPVQRGRANWGVPPSPGNALEEAREQLQVPRSVSFTVAGKSGVSVLDVGGVGDLRGLAIGHDVDSGFGLPPNGFGALLGHAGCKVVGVIGLSTLAGEDEVDRALAARQRADVGGCDSGHAALLRDPAESPGL